MSTAVDKPKKVKLFPDGTKDIARGLKVIRKVHASFQRSAEERPNAATIAVKMSLIQDFGDMLERMTSKYGGLGYDRAIQAALPVIEEEIAAQLVANADRKAKMKGKGRGPKEGPKKAIKKH